MQNVFMVLAMVVTMQAQAAPSGWLTTCKVVGSENGWVTMGWGDKISPGDGVSWKTVAHAVWIAGAADGWEADKQGSVFSEYSGPTRCGPQSHGSVKFSDGAEVSYYSGNGCGGEDQFSWTLTLPGENGDQGKQYQLECADKAPPAKKQPCVGRRVCSYETL